MANLQPTVCHYTVSFTTNGGFAHGSTLKFPTVGEAAAYAENILDLRGKGYVIWEWVEGQEEPIAVASQPSKKRKVP
jgi:hypothetical protein